MKRENGSVSNKISDVRVEDYTGTVDGKYITYGWILFRDHEEINEYLLENLDKTISTYTDIALSNIHLCKKVLIYDRTEIDKINPLMLEFEVVTELYYTPENKDETEYDNFKVITSKLYYIIQSKILEKLYGNYEEKLSDVNNFIKNMCSELLHIYKKDIANQIFNTALSELQKFN